jgi:long-chain-fatty-acid--[acyl-carrier-protein] ligase
MSTFFWNCLAKLAFALLSLRYKIRVKGLDALDKISSKEGILFLPNHPAHMDPLFLFLLLWPRYRMRPVVVEYVYRLTLLQSAIRFIRAVPIPNFDTSINPMKVKRANDAIQEMANGLKKGENFILYPAGKLKSAGREKVGAASGAHALVQECPKARIVLIRTTGLWGSSFSRAFLGATPHLPDLLWNGVKTLLKNGIFFAPRRNVEIEFALDEGDLPRNGNRLEFNRALENWFNRYPNGSLNVLDAEPLSIVPYSRWQKELPKVFQPQSKKRASEEIEISDETRSKIYEEIRKIINNASASIAPEMDLATDLGLDSLNIAELLVFISKNYDVREIHPEDIGNVQSVLEIAQGAKTGPKTPRKEGTFHWPEEKERPVPTIPAGKTFAEVFLNSCQKMDGFVAAGDDLIGPISYKKMKRAALVLSRYFKQYPDPYVAVLLPSSVVAFLIILALQFAGKIPVMLNWTLGSRFLEDMMKESKAKTVVSSWRFLDRLSHVDLGNLVDRLELIEDIRGKLSLGMKLRGAILSLLPPSWILRFLKLDKIDEDETGVILFTSGTEAKPKGVPLSHKNIISNQRAMIQCVDFLRTDVIYSILPPFHSFGFSVVGLFPLFCGMRVAFYPDPTDGFALAEGIERWNVTLFCSPPSFTRGLLNSASPGQLKNIRLFFSGAEKAPPELFERIEKLGTHVRLAEGYGITECSPTLTFARTNLPQKGVGQPLPGVEICTIHPETQELLPKGGEGEICVRGPNVFRGYLGHPRDAFIEIDGKRWYRTGDIGRLDEDGNLIISGRIKRFTKVGGEMISLGGVEETLVTNLISQGKISDKAPAIAVVADEKKEGQPQLVLFTTASITREEANQILQTQGFSRLVKISAVKKIEEIPMLGTGKTDYKSLQNRLTA